MRVIRAWLLRAAGLVGGARRDSDIASELHAHLDPAAAIRNE
jgi:hypothetical protein